jgi:hypothetical protein
VATSAEHPTSGEHALRKELRDVEMQIAEQRASADELREQIGGHDAGPQDPEDVAAALTSVEEIEGVLDGLGRRRESLLAELGDG